MKRLILLTTIISLACFLARKANSSVVAGNNTPAPNYEVRGMVTLKVWNGVEVQATIENLRDSITAILGQKPRSKLVIKNLSTGAIIHQEECGDSTLSYPGFDVRRGTALVMTTKGGSGDGIRVYEVTESDARVVLAEGYRAAALLMPNDELGGDMGFLIIDAESGASPLVAKRYQYEDSRKKYLLTGKAPFGRFIQSVKAQFGKSAR